MFSSHPRKFQSVSPHYRGFSLVEVVIAVGVVSFAFVAILGLIPAGMSQFRQAMDTSASAQIAQRVIGDAQQTDFDVLTQTADPRTAAPNFTFLAPTVANPRVRYFDEAANEVVPAATTGAPNAAEQALIVYHVITRIAPTTALPQPDPAASLKSPTIATVTVQVAFNPGNKKLTYTKTSGAAPTGNLFAAAPGINVKTFSVQIGRNQ